ncbi:MAG: DNA ligase LigA-related protein [Fusobacteriaceae bacterium]
MKQRKKYFQLPASITETPIRELIRRRRRQIAIHSIIYYRYDVSIVSDALFDSWCNELIRLQREYPIISKHVELHEHFENLTHASGFNLTCLTDVSLIYVAERLLRIKGILQENK